LAGLGIHIPVINNARHNHAITRQDQGLDTVIIGHIARSTED